jgi:hypothetical protein
MTPERLAELTVRCFCGGESSVSIAPTKVHGQYQRITDCATCHVRTFAHVYMAAETNPARSPYQILCGQCRKVTNKISACKTGMLVCTECLEAMRK